MMKRLTLPIMIGMLLCACTGQKSTDAEETLLDSGTQTYTYQDSCQHLMLSLSLELPCGEDSASIQIRDSLIADFVRCASQPGYAEDGAQQIAPYGGTHDDVQALVDYYGKAGYERLLKMALSDYEDRISYLAEDTTMSAEDKEMIRNDVPMWAFDLNVRKVSDTLGIVVYNAQAYSYYGGAHGGVTGTGAMTFDKATGSKIARFINADATGRLQPLIRQGLLQYYSDMGDTITDEQLSQRLQIADTIIPQPQENPHPNATADSLVFTYGQYEIACYADGMPSFKLAISDLAPYLTPEGKALIEKAQEQKALKSSL